MLNGYHVTNEEVHRKIHTAIEKCDKLLTLVKKRKLRCFGPRFNVFWLSKDNPTGHSERTKKMRQTEEEVGRQYQRVDRIGLCQLNWLKTGQDGKGLLRTQLWCSDDLSRVWNRIEYKVLLPLVVVFNHSAFQC